MTADTPRRRFTADEVLRMVEAGILHEDEPVELIDGELYAVSPQGRTHSFLAVRVHRRLERAFGDDFYVQDHSPVAGGRHSLPEPDVAVIRGAPEDLLDRHPGCDEVALIVELSVTTQAYDRFKAGVYARAGFPIYWQLDVPARRLTAYAEPVGGEYRSIRLHLDGEEVDPGCGPIPVADLLPPVS